MKKILAILLVLAAPLLAQPCPWEVWFEGNFVGKSNFETPAYKEQEISLWASEAEISLTVPFDRCNPCTGLIFALGWTHTHLGWDENPYFYEQDYDFANFSFGGYTLAIRDWRWIAKATLAVDPREWDRNYNLAFMTLWGKYTHCYWRCGDVNLHIGIWGRTGLENNWILPILGVDFQPYQKLKVNLIYPIDISVNYLFTECFFASINAHPVARRRHRVGNEEPRPRHVYEYRNSGWQLGLNYDSQCHYFLNAHLGWAWGGDLKIMTPNGRSIEHLKFDGAWYAGGKATVKF